MRRSSFNYGDIARIGARINKDQLFQYAGILESISEGPRPTVTNILRELMTGTIGKDLPEDARQLLIAVAQNELRIR